LGDAPLTYKWFVNGVEQTGINSNVLTLNRLTIKFNQAKVKVVVSNAFGKTNSQEVLLTVVDPYGESRIGFLLKQSWYKISGTKVSVLRSYAKFPDNPDSISFVNKYEIPTNVADNYGVKLSGWLIAPKTGDYTFYFASDDNGELWLSTDSMPENLRVSPIAFVPEWSDSRQYDKFAEQTSKSIFLEAGKKYYTEAFIKEEGGGDNLAVAWKLPDGTLENPIPSQRLAFYTAGSTVDIDNHAINNNELLVYPSPASDKVYVKSNLLGGKIQFAITDISGRTVKSGIIDQTNNETVEINVSDLNVGIYILNISNSRALTNSKFIINR